MAVLNAVLYPAASSKAALLHAKALAATAAITLVGIVELKAFVQTFALTFLGGAWMPLSLMGSAVQTVAHFVPTFWVNDAIGKALASDLTSTVLGDIACDLGVTVLFAAAIAAVGLALAHNKSRA